MVCGKELPLESKQSDWKSSEDTNHRKYFYNTLTKISSWDNPDDYVNNRTLRAYLFVLERPLFSSMGAWRFHKL